MGPPIRAKVSRTRKASPEEAFFEHVPELFQRSKPAWEKAYNELIYSIRRPLTAQNARDVVQWLDGGRVAWSKEDMERLNTVLLRMRWPDVRSLATLRSIDGMTLPRACALLHFHNPSFPSFAPEAVQGLALLGTRIRRPEALGQEEVRAYRRYMDAITEFKDHIPFRFVPESHYFHSWVLECALGELARQQGRAAQP
jgi:hypothetical protein